jgi:hypothetical protein
MNVKGKENKLIEVLPDALQRDNINYQNFMAHAEFYIKGYANWKISNRSIAKVFNQVYLLIKEIK